MFRFVLFEKLSYKQVKTPGSINPATNCFDQFVVSTQFKSLPLARACMCVILFINRKLVFGLWLLLGSDCRLGLNNVQYATRAQTHSLCSLCYGESSVIYIPSCCLPHSGNKDQPMKHSHPFVPTSICLSLIHTHAHKIQKPAHDSTTYSE